MKLFTLVVLVACLCPPVFAQEVDDPKLAESDSLTCEIRYVENGLLPENRTWRATFFGSNVVEYELEDGDSVLSAVYDLDEMTITHDDLIEMQTLESCQKWERITSKNHLKHVDQSDQRTVKYFQNTFNPAFTIAKTSDGMEFRDPVRRIRIHDRYELSKEQTAKFLAYHRLHTYLYPMLDRKIAPTPMIAVNKELSERHFVPKLIIATVRESKTKRTRIKISKATAKEVAEAKAAIGSINTTNQQ